MNRIILSCVVCIFLLAACATSETTTGKSEMQPAAGPATAETVETSSGSMLDNLEKDMQQAVASSDMVTLQREGDLLTVTLKGDAAFDTGSTAVKAELDPEISQIAQVLNRYPAALITIEGHADSSGQPEANMNLSKQRAESIRNLLIHLGLSPRWIGVAGLGDTKPLASNDTEDGRRKNRRVEIKISMPAQ